MSLQAPSDRIQHREGYIVRGYIHTEGLPDEPLEEKEGTPWLSMAHRHKEMTRWTKMIQREGGYTTWLGEQWPDDNNLISIDDLKTREEFIFSSDELPELE